MWSNWSYSHIQMAVFMENLWIWWFSSTTTKYNCVYFIPLIQFTIAWILDMSKRMKMEHQIRDFLYFSLFSLDLILCSGDLALDNLAFWKRCMKKASKGKYRQILVNCENPNGCSTWKRIISLSYGSIFCLFILFQFDKHIHILQSIKMVYRFLLQERTI